MRKLLLTIALLATLPAFGQSDSKEANTSKFSFGIAVSPDYNIRLPFEYGREYDLPNKGFIEIEIPQFGLTTELSGIYHVKPWIELQTGLRYTLMRYETKTLPLDFCDEFAGTPCPTDVPTDVKFNVRHHIIGIPLRANATFGKRRLRFGIGVGCTANILVASTKKERLGFADGSVTNKTFKNAKVFKPFTLTPELAAGIRYDLTSSTYIKAEPTLRALMPRGYMFGFGLNLGYYKYF